MAFPVEKLEPIAAALRGAGFTGVTTEVLNKDGVPVIHIVGARTGRSLDYSLAIEGMTDDQVVLAAQSAALGWALRGRR